MGLREDALAAAAAAVEERQTAARAALAARLTPAEVDGLEVVDTATDVVVFTDGTLYLAVRDKVIPQAVYLVDADGAGGWTRRGEVPDLPALGKLIAPETPA